MSRRAWLGREVAATDHLYLRHAIIRPHQASSSWEQFRSKVAALPATGAASDAIEGLRFRHPLGMAHSPHRESRMPRSAPEIVPSSSKSTRSHIKIGG